jgi:cell division protein FtsQ
MTFNWKKTAIVLIDALLAVYLVLAITAFNNPDEVNSTCDEVSIHIEDGLTMGFLNVNEVKGQLQRAKLYPLGDVMNNVNTRKIEETLKQNPFVEQAQCYKTQTGHVYITLSQRMPVIRIKADNGEDYYVDEHGDIMPYTHYVNDIVVATGDITKKYAQKSLTKLGNFLVKHPLWRSQVEQVHVLPDGTIEIVPRVGDHIVYLGMPFDLEQKFKRLEKFYRYGLSEAGWNKYSYINLEFRNQIICKKRNIKETEI